MSGKSIILVIGGKWYIGKFIVEAAVKVGHLYSALVWQSTLSNHAESEIVEKFRGLGVKFIEGDFNNERSLEKAIGATDVVISAARAMLVAHQEKIIAALKKSGNVKVSTVVSCRDSSLRSSETMWNGPMLSNQLNLRTAPKQRFDDLSRRRTSHIPTSLPTSSRLNTLSQPVLKAPPRDKVIILGNGDPKAVFNKEEDIATYTIKAVDDPRTLNKILYIRPPQNVYSFNDIVSLREQKIEASQGNLVMSISHSVFVLGDQTNFEIEHLFGDASRSRSPQRIIGSLHELTSVTVIYVLLEPNED